MLLFTHHYPARCFGMNMPKSRDIQAKIPLPQAIWNFGYVTENGVNSNWKIANWEGVCYDRTDGERR